MFFYTCFINKLRIIKKNIECNVIHDLISFILNFTIRFYYLDVFHDALLVYISYAHHWIYYILSIKCFDCIHVPEECRRHVFLIIKRRLITDGILAVVHKKPMMIARYRSCVIHSLQKINKGSNGMQYWANIKFRENISNEIPLLIKHTLVIENISDKMLILMKYGMFIKEPYNFSDIYNNLI